MEASSNVDGTVRTITVIDSTLPDTVNHVKRAVHTNIVWHDTPKQLLEEPGQEMGGYFGITYSTGSVKSGDLYSINSIGLTAEQFLTENIRADVSVSGGYAALRTTGKLYRSLEDRVMIYSAGFDINLFTTFQHTFFGHYLFFGGDYCYMEWRYIHTISISPTEVTGNVTSWRHLPGDALHGGDIHIGVGVNFIQTKHVIVGTEVQTGVIFWGLTTQRGFENDVFDPWLYVRLGVGVKGKW